MKIKASLYVSTHFKCAFCGKVFDGEKDKMDRKLVAHCLTHHPIKLLKKYQNCRKR